MEQLNSLQRIPGLVHAFSTKEEGNMSWQWGEANDVLRHRTSFFRTAKIEPDACVSMSLQHFQEIRVVSRDQRGTGMPSAGGIDADCLVTTDAGTFLFVVTADCLPVIICDPEQKLVALVHISRANLGPDFLAKVVSRLHGDFGAKPETLTVGIGPGIHQGSFLLENPEQLSQPAWQRFLPPAAYGQVAVDLLGFARQQLLDAGVTEKNLEISPSDTATSAQYFSHYRSVRTGELEGRFATVVGFASV